MKKCDSYCCCSEEMACNALPGKTTAFPPPAIFPWVQDDGREVVPVPKRPFLCSGREGLPSLSQGAPKLFQHILGERQREGGAGTHPWFGRAAAGVHRGRTQRPRGKAAPHSSTSARGVPCGQGFPSHTERHGEAI